MKWEIMNFVFVVKKTGKIKQNKTKQKVDIIRMYERSGIFKQINKSWLTLCFLIKSLNLKKIYFYKTFSKKGLFALSCCIDKIPDKHKHLMCLTSQIV